MSKERKKGLQQEELSRVKEQLQSMLENIGDGFFACDEGWRFVYVNAQAERILGIRREEVLGKSLWEVFPLTLGTRLEHEYRRAAAGEIRAFENFYEPWGRWFHNRCFPREEGGMLVYFQDITERKRAEEALWESKQRMQEILESISDGFWAVDSQWRFIYINPRGAQNVGFQPDDLIGKNLWDTFPSIRNTSYEHHYRKVMAERLPCSFEIVGVLTSRAYSVSVYPSGEGISVYWQDITERKAAEDVLHQAMKAKEETLALLDAIFNSAPIGLGFFDKNMRFVRLNQALADFNGLPLHEHLGKAIDEILPDGVATRELVAAWQHILETGQPMINVELSSSIPVQPGKTHYWMASWYPVKVRGEAIGLSAIVIDITGKKQGEEAVRQHMEELEKLMDMAPVAIWVSHDPECRHIIGNRMANEFYEAETGENVSAGPAPGEPIPPRTFISGDRELSAEELPMQVAASQNIEVRNSELEVILPSNRHIYMLGSTSPLRDARGRVRGCLGAFLNITDRKRAEDQIKNSLREKEVLLKEIHHRVKNNLQIINSMLNLQLPYIKDKQAIESFKESQNRIYTMALIHEKLYQSESLARIDLAEYIRPLTTHLFISYGVSEGAIKLNMHIENITLDVDRVIPCALIINELVSNSLKYAFPDLRKRPEEVRAKVIEEILIDFSRTDDHTLMLTVGDNGRGLPEGFEIRKCTSLGLKLVNVLVKQLKGDIHLGRPETGDGAEFIITFEDSKMSSARQTNSSRLNR